MLVEPRRRLLLELISRQGYATLDQLVKSLGVSESTVARDWRFARVWLHREMSGEEA
jgi:DeoR/GlpR family transcriptional regulator of sugar metabolism